MTLGELYVKIQQMVIQDGRSLDEPVHVIDYTTENARRADVRQVDYDVRYPSRNERYSEIVIAVVGWEDAR